MPGLEVNLPTSDRTRIWFLWSNQAISILSPVILAIIFEHNLILAHLQSPQALAKLLTRRMHTEAMNTDHMWSAIQNIYNTCKCLLLIEGGNPYPLFDRNIIQAAEDICDYYDDNST